MKLFGSKRQRIIAADLGTTSFKVAEVQRDASGLTLTAFGAKPIPSGAIEKRDVKELVSVLKSLLAERNIPAGPATAVVSPRSSLLRIVELPLMPLNELKQSLKANSLRFLHQDCSSYAMDCHILGQKSGAAGDTTANRVQVLVVGAPMEEVRFYRDIMAAAGLKPREMTLSAIAMLNAFEASQAKDFTEETVSLIDAANMSSTMLVLHKGVPMLTRSLQFGGNHLRSTLMRALNLDAAKAEKESLTMGDAAQKALQRPLDEFAKEIRSSVDFFEHQRGEPVSKIYLAGGNACQPFVLTFLQEHVGMPCLAWNPAQTITQKLSTERSAELLTQGPIMAAAIGAAITSS